jgi:hypothetical protein
LRCVFGHNQSVSGRGEERKKDRDQRGGRGYSVESFTNEIRRRSLGSPARDFSPMAASPVRVLEGEGRGECRLEWEGFKEREALQEVAG